AGQETIHVDMSLFASRPVTVRVESEGEPVTKFEAYGNERWEWQQQDGPEFEIVDLRPGERRKVFVFHRGRNLAGGGFVEYGANEAVRIELVKAGSVTGRLVDADGEPIDDATLFVNYEKLRSGDDSAIWARHPTLSANPTKIPVDKNGRFRLDGLIPGWTYHAYASAPRPYQNQMISTIIGSPLKGVQVNAGEVKDLGDLVVGDDKTASDGENKQAAAEKTESADDDLVTVSGTVVDPQKRPLAEAKVFAVRWYWDSRLRQLPLSETQSDSQGHFSISFRRSQFKVDLGQIDQWKNTTIVATADGFGPAWVTWRKLRPGEQPTLRLATDDVPVTGRVVDLEGRPISGVTVQAGSIDLPKQGKLDDWLAAIGRGESRWTARRYMDDDLPECDSFSPRTVTDGDGQFRLTGLGAERVVHLSLSGPDTGYSRVLIVTRRLPPVATDQSTSRDRREAVYGAHFQFVAPPTRTIEGVVRAADTGVPMAGVAIESDQFAGMNVSSDRALRTVTDDAGRYRLTGMPKGKGNRVVAVPNDDQPYLMRELDVADEPGLAPVQVDFALHRGLWITGRITDRATGKPLVARVHYLPFRTNEFARRRPEFAETGNGHGNQQRYVSGADGRYRLLGLPGRAIVGTECVMGHYRRGVGAEVIAGMNAEGNFDTFHSPGRPGKKWPHAMKEINPAPDADSVVCDLDLDAGQAMTVKVVDPAGKPIVGFTMDGRTPDGEALIPAESSMVEVLNLSDDEVRTLVVQHAPRRLGKVVRLRLAEHPQRETTVMLQPTGKIAGRLLDRKGDALSGASITALVHPIEDFAKTLPPATTDDDGRFEYTDIPTGCTYELDADVAGMNGPGWFAEDLALEPGETKELGDVVYGSVVESDKDPKAKQTTKEKPANASEHVAVRVVDTSGQPVAGARVRVLRCDTHEAWVETVQVVGEARSDQPGTAMVTYTAAGPFATTDVLNKAEFDVFAEAPGHAIDWQRVPSSGAVTLRLPPDDVAIEGRVLDLEGRPRSGIRVSVIGIVSGGNAVDAWVESAKHNPAVVEPTDTRAMEKLAMFPHEKGLAVAPRDTLPPTFTDKQGRFRLSGLGRDRLVGLELAGPGMAKMWLHVLTRDMPPVPYPEWGDPRYLVPSCFGARFDLSAEPDQPITGTVRDTDSGGPLPGVEVRLSHYADYADGSFFVDVPKRDSLGPVTCDARLKRAIWVRGRVTEAVSGAPVRGMLVYRPFFSNTAAAKYPRFGNELQNRYPTDDGGRYRLPVLPGRGVVAFIAAQTERYPEGDGADAIADLRKPDSKELNVAFIANVEIEEVTALREINPADDARDAICDIQLRPLAVAEVELVDADGQPVAGAVTSHLLPIRMAVGYYAYWSQDPLPAATAAIVGPRDPERTVMFLHRERKLAAAVPLSADRDPPKQITLRPCASISGRAVDRTGKPVGDFRVRIAALAQVNSAKPRDVGQWLASLKTDNDGRFRVELVPPGVAYVLSARRGRKTLTAETKTVAPGESIDLGDVVLAEADTTAEGSAVEKAPAIQPADGKIVRGRVLLPGGTPAAGADLYWTEIELSGTREIQKAVPRGTANDEGRFEISLSESDLPATLTPQTLIARKAGYGIAWLRIARKEIPGDIALQLAEDRPIRGRVMDTEGRPVIEAKVSIGNILASRDRNLDAFLLAWKQDWRDAYTKLDAPGGFCAVFDPLDTVTSQEGRFEISGVGVERVAAIEIRAAGYAYDQLDVVTRQNFDAHSYNEAAR
ncbi:MAG TPA: carboxypeptidase-like regulatory domain-containing protein, partial [Pirellulales bacterium]|nr:carboxypeptidase-like regulatory domain-containing protein [Pirellulales bacterium]